MQGTQDESEEEGDGQVDEAPLETEWGDACGRTPIYLIISNSVIRGTNFGRSTETLGNEHMRTRNQGLNFGPLHITSSKRSMASSTVMILCTTCR